MRTRISGGKSGFGMSPNTLIIIFGIAILGILVLMLLRQSSPIVVMPAPAAASTDLMPSMPSVSQVIAPVVSTVPLTPPVNNFDFARPTGYKEIGLLKDGNEILPLVGRPHPSQRNKWEYFTMANNGFATKLPVSVKGKNCTGEYGCDEITTNDSIFADGADKIYKATVYENKGFSYNPNVI